MNFNLPQGKGRVKKLNDRISFASTEHYKHSKEHNFLFSLN